MKKGEETIGSDRQGHQEQGGPAVQAGRVPHHVRQRHQPQRQPDRRRSRAVEAGLVRKAGAWYTYEGDQLGQGKENARQFLFDNPDLANELEKKILEKLGVGPQVDEEEVSDTSDLSDEPIGVDSF